MKLVLAVVSDIGMSSFGARSVPWVRDKVRRQRIIVMRHQRAYEEATSEELLAWSADGDRRAFDRIVERHGPMALRIALRLIPDVAVAEDITQEALVRAWTKASHFDPRRSGFTTWFYRIVTNLCIDYRRRVRPLPLPDDFDLEDPSAGAEEMLERDERSVVLTAALKELPARQRAALTLVYDEGMSGAEAARVLGISPKAVERLLARARAFLYLRLRAGGVWTET